MYIGTGELWWIKMFDGLMGIHCTYTHDTGSVFMYVCTEVHLYYVSWLKVKSKDMAYVLFPCTSSEQVKLMYFLTKPD